jgi:hypothetical protein
LKIIRSNCNQIATIDITSASPELKKAFPSNKCLTRRNIKQTTPVTLMLDNDSEILSQAHNLNVFSLKPDICKAFKILAFQAPASELLYR